MKRWHSVAIAAVTLTCGLATGAAQSAPSRPTPVQSAKAPATDKPNFSGLWILNTDLSDNPTQAGLGPGQRQGDGPRSGGRRGGFGGGFGGRGGFGGGYGRGGFAGGQRPQGSPGDSSRTQLFNEVRNPSATLMISHSDPGLTITNAQDKTRVFQTNGKKDTHQFDSGTVDSTTKWDGSRLVTEYDLGNGRKLRYVYSLLPNTRQLLEQVTFEGGQSQSGRSSAPIKRVYDAARPPRR